MGECVRLHGLTVLAAEGEPIRKGTIVDQAPLQPKKSVAQ